MYTTKDIGRTVTDKNGVVVRIVADVDIISLPAKHDICDACFYNAGSTSICRAYSALGVAIVIGIGCDVYPSFHFERVDTQEGE